ncbi:MAG: hypothetical protein QOH41_704 [Blastocatellia bacterium]|nr:hypothetical protein [Blastocatellia bacterium]
MTISKLISTKSPWLLGPQGNSPARLRLFCFPYAGGAAAIYQSWQESLPPTVEVRPVQLPGRGTRMRETPFNQLSDLVDATARALVPYLDKPFAFFGHSMGALLSFELTRRLRREHGLSPVQLFLSGRRAPRFPHLDPVTYNLPDREFLDELRRLKGTPPEMLENAELMQLMLPLLRADFEVCETYCYSDEPPLECPVTVFGGLQDIDVGRTYLEPWREETSGSFSLRMLPGDHFFLQASKDLLIGSLVRDLYQYLKIAA